MALWLFRRKSRRKRSHTGMEPTDKAVGPAPRSFTTPNGVPPSAVDRKQSVRRERSQAKKLHRRARTYSFEEGRRDSIYINARKSRPGKHDPVPALPPHLKTDPTISASHYTETDGSTADALADLDRIPTLHATKRDGQHLMPRKSSKRRKNAHDREREAELKALSNFVPVRPATDAWTAGRPMKKDTRRVRTGLGLGIGGSARWDNPSSDVSLPIAESLHSTLSSDSEQFSYKVSALDALAPKPTLRYAINPRYAHPNGAAPPQRIPSQRRRLTEKGAIPESTLRAHKRIDDLADDLSASDLRELMERDQRRRERQHQKEQDRIERRLARRAEKERLAAENGSQAPQNLERGVLGREAVGLGIDTTSAVVTSSKRRLSDGDDQTGEAARSEEKPGDQLPDPLETFHRTTSIPLDPEPSSREVQQPTPPPAVVNVRRSFLRTQKSASKSSFSEQEKLSLNEDPRRGSESSPARGAISWSSIFKWGNKNKRHSGPSSFSNTSRDSMATQPPVAPSAGANTHARAVSSGVPKRTGSRFREDLPDFLMSPPDSRVQSPETEPVPPAIMEQESPPMHDAASPALMTPQDTRVKGPSVQEDPSPSHQNAVDPSPEPQSLSLASIDSEASWLSGRVGSRRQSSQMARHRDSVPQSMRTYGSNEASDKTAGSQEHESPGEDAAGIADDEYMNRVACHSGNRLSVGEARPSSDEEDDPRWGAVGGQVPTVVHAHKANRIKSREGLLHTYGEEDESDSPGSPNVDSPVSPTSPTSDLKEEGPGVQRATSVNLGKGHARHISAGSAKLLEITPRSSVDVKRRSWETRQGGQ